MSPSDPLRALALPRGYAHRPLTLGDSAAVARILTAQEVHDVGRATVHEADIRGDWARPSFSVAESTLGIFEGDTLVAYGELTMPTRADTAVHPDHRGRGLGTAIAHWTQALARERGEASVGMQVPQGSSADRLLTGLGYHASWTSWDLVLPPGAELPDIAPPTGFELREAERREFPACCNLIEDAFLEWAERERMSVPDWLAKFTGRDGFEPWNVRVAVDGHGAIVAAAVIVRFEGDGYLEQLATRKDHRGRGLGVAMLVDAFRAAAANGNTGARLSTDSRTGALGLYERIGMVVESTWVHRAKTLERAAD